MLLVFLFAGFRAHRHTLKIGGTLWYASVVLVAGQYVAMGNWAFFFIAALNEYSRERHEHEQAVREFSRFVDPHVVRAWTGS